MRSLSTLTKARITHGAAKRRITPRMKVPTVWKKSRGGSVKLLGSNTFCAKPQTGGLPPLPKIGLSRQKMASHHRLNATYRPRPVQGTLMAR